MNMDESSVQNPQPGMQINLDINKTPVLYTDLVLLASDKNDFGVVFNFAQAAGDQANIVARVGMSVEHAHNFLETVNDHLAKNSGNRKK
jgi:hypothetical protein